MVRLKKRAAVSLAGLDATSPALEGPDVDNVRRLAAAVGLIETEVVLLVAGVRCHPRGLVGTVFWAALLNVSENEAYRRLASILALDEAAVKQSLLQTGQLKECGLLSNGDDETSIAARTLVPRLLFTTC
jgi:hypothetical protein